MINLEEVIKCCNPYLSVLGRSKKGSFLTRSGHFANFDIEYFKSSTEFRKPRDMPINVHAKVNERFKNEFGWLVRNGVFTYGVSSSYFELNDMGYGPTYLFFPCGNFKYVYDRNIFDMYGSYYNFEIENPDLEADAFIETINYENANLENVISTVCENGRSVEISINCQGYFLADMKHVPQLIDLIWK